MQNQSQFVHENAETPLCGVGKEVKGGCDVGKDSFLKLPRVLYFTEGEEVAVASFSIQFVAHLVEFCSVISGQQQPCWMCSE